MAAVGTLAMAALSGDASIPKFFPDDPIAREPEPGGCVPLGRSVIFAQSFFEFGLCSPITEQRLLVLVIGVGDG